MRIRIFLFWLASLSGLVLSASQRRGHRLARGLPPSHAVHEKHERRHLEGWVKRDLVDADATVPVRIGLRQSNLDAGHDLLMEISNPRSPKYGKHLSRREVIDLFAPREPAVEKVKRWLVESGVNEKRLSQSDNKQWIQFDAPVHEVEDLLITDYHVYENVETGIQSIACSQYHVPHNVSHHIDYITPGIKLATGAYDEKIVKRMIGRRHLTGDLPRKGQRRGSGTGEGKGKGVDTWITTTRASAKTPTRTAPATPKKNWRGKEKCKPKPSPDPLPVHPGEINPSFLVRGPCTEEITAHCIRTQYQIPNGTKATKGNELGIFQSLDQHYSQEDLDNYWKHVAPWVPHGTHPELRAINGAYGPTNDTSQAGEEADLDFQVAIPLVWPQRTVLFQTDDEWYQRDQQRADSRYPGFFNTFWDALDESYCTMTAFNMTGNCDTPDCRDPEYPNPNATPDQGGYQGPLMCGAHRPTNVISISYSGTEHSWPANYMRRQCLEVMKLALQGITVVESTGDFGVGGRWMDPHAGCLGERRDVFSPRVMGNCPYVLSVGATTLVPPEAVPKGEKPKLVEVAAEAFASGGGFSNVFERPKWQDRHVLGYFDRANVTHMGYVTDGEGYAAMDPPPPPGKLFNMAGRGYPDVSALGEGFRVVLRGYSTRMHGTSVSTPVWASILTLINEERLAAGKSTVGFVHQVLYEHPEVFNDITVGSNPGCGGDGFEVKEGWDPITGLGSPIYPKLLELFMSLP